MKGKLLSLLNDYLIDCHSRGVNVPDIKVSKVFMLNLISELNHEFPVQIDPNSSSFELNLHGSLYKIVLCEGYDETLDKFILRKYIYQN